MANDARKLSGVDILNKKKGLLISPELCIGCRGCQTACKEWNKLPGDKTENKGSYENPADLTPNLFTKIRFVETTGKPVDWLFVSRRCMHCGDAGCMSICPAPGAIYRTAEGAVAYDKNKCIGCKLCQAGCPFDVPRYDADNKIAKCHLCEDRISNGLAPACAKTCPTGAIKYGERDKLIKSAKDAKFETVYGETDLSGLGVVFALKNKPSYYGMDASPGLPPSIAFWRYVLKPLAVIGLGAGVAAVAAHYLTIGPKTDEEEGGEG